MEFDIINNLEKTLKEDYHIIKKIVQESGISFNNYEKYDNCQDCKKYKSYDDALMKVIDYYKFIQDHKNVEKYLLLADEIGDTLALWNLGRYYQLTGFEYKKMEKYYLLSYEKRGRCDGLYNLAIHYGYITDFCNMIKYFNITFRFENSDNQLQIIERYRDLIQKYFGSIIHTFTMQDGENIENIKLELEKLSNDKCIKSTECIKNTDYLYIFKFFNYNNTFNEIKKSNYKFSFSFLAFLNFSLIMCEIIIFQKNDTKLMKNIINYYRSFKKTDTIMEFCLFAIKNGNYDFYSELALYYKNKNDINNFIKCHQILLHRGNFFRLNEIIVYYVQIKNIKKIIKYCKIALKVGMANNFIINQVIINNFRLKNFQTVLKYFDIAIKYNCAEGIFLIGVCYKKIKKYDKMHQCFDIIFDKLTHCDYWKVKIIEFIQDEESITHYYKNEDIHEITIDDIDSKDFCQHHIASLEKKMIVKDNPSIMANYLKIYDQKIFTSHFLLNTCIRYLRGKKNYDLIDKYELAACNFGYHELISEIINEYIKLDRIFFSDKIEKYLKIAFDQNISNASYLLGLHYSFKKDYVNMIKYYEIAISQENDLAMADLGDYYRHQKDDEKMEKYYLMAIENKNNYAMTQLANFYFNTNFEIAEKYYKMAIEYKNTCAMNNLALLYNKLGQSVKMTKYFIMSAKYGNKESILNLKIYFNEIKNTYNEMKINNNLQGDTDNYITDEDMDCISNKGYMNTKTECLICYENNYVACYECKCKNMNMCHKCYMILKKCPFCIQQI